MRLLISIGCNVYDHAPVLKGAEADAHRMFEALIRPDVGEYDPARSKLLLSPSMDELRQALRDVLFSNGAIDTFTFFFAGHGGVRAGSFYMWLRDSRPDAQSMTALSLSDVFRNLNEAAPAQSNIIIDACESGGLIADLGVLLKPDVRGDVGTPVVTLVATSAQNQYSGETQAGGLGTKQFWTASKAVTSYRTMQAPLTSWKLGAAFQPAFGRPTRALWFGVSICMVRRAFVETLAMVQILPGRYARSFKTGHRRATPRFVNTTMSFGRHTPR